MTEQLSAARIHEYGVISQNAMEEGGRRVAFIIRNVGDLHASRLLQLSADLAADGRGFLVIEAAKASAWYSHIQSRTAILRQGFNCITLGCTGRIRSAKWVIRELIRYRPQSILVIGYNDELSLAALAL